MRLGGIASLAYGWDVPALRVTETGLKKDARCNRVGIGIDLHELGSYVDCTYDVHGPIAINYLQITHAAYPVLYTSCSGVVGSGR